MTENGWEPSPRIEPDSPLLAWKTVPGTNVTLQVRNDAIGTVMLAFAADFNMAIEPLRDADSACYTPTNSVATSNHLNATAMDLNWDTHPFQTRGTFTDEKVAKIRPLLDFYEGWIFWAGDWDSPVDEMHWQAGYDTYGRDVDLADFIRRKIGADGFSTFGAPGQAQPPDSPAKVLYDAVPVIDEDRAAQLVDAVIAGLAAAQCDNPRRIAMFLAQCGHESDGFATTQEYGTGQRYAPYIGRTWIQITWQANYAAFGRWAADQGLIDDPNYFVDNPTALADLKWAGLGAAWYWTVARPTIKDLSDNGDVVGVTQLINGGQNGIADRNARYQQAIALGDGLLALVAPPQPQPGDVITLPDTITRAEWDDLVADVKEIRAQLSGDWPQNGNDPKAAADLDKRKAAGDRLTPNDLLAWMKNHVSTHKAPTP